MSRLLRLLLSGVVLATVSPFSVSAQDRHFPDDEALRAIVRYLVEDTPVAGMVLGVLEADGTTRIVSYGTAGPDARPLGPESVFEIGSITKTFTGTLLADLVARGVVTLDDPVATYLPDSVRVPARGDREITLLDLATHRSGLPRLATNHEPADSNDPYADYTIETMYAFLGEHELRRDPGAEYEYSNLGFQLLGHAIARAAGSSLTELVRSRMIEPLGMARTGYDLEGDVADWMVQGHRRLAVTSFNTGNEARRGAGGLRSNVIDMLEYLKANVGPAESTMEAALRAAHEPRATFGERGGMIGLAWVTTEVGGRRIVEHGGGTGGFTSRIAFDPERRVGYVLLTNSRLFADATANEMLAFGPPADFPSVTVDPAMLLDVTGVYLLGPEEPLYLRVEPDGQLTLQIDGRTRAPLSARSDSTFSLEHAPVTLTVRRDLDGEVTGLVYHREGSPVRVAERTGRRMPEPQAVRAGAVWSSVTLEWGSALRSAGIAAVSIALLTSLLLGVARWRGGPVPPQNTDSGSNSTRSSR